MGGPSASRLYVFRDARRVERGRDMIAGLAADLRRAASAPGGAQRDQALIDALVRAGEVEAAFSDAACASDELRAAAEHVARITDALAGCLVDRGRAPPVSVDLEAPLCTMPAPELVRVSPHESFAYYGLHPKAFVDLAAVAVPSPARAVVIGIRSIGATLSAVVAAALRARGADVQRLTVRPHGHPYARSLAFDGRTRSWLQREDAQGAAFLVADEGPGLSGSSFLAVGEALCACGVPAHRVAFLCSRAVDPSTLLALDVAPRWRAFRSLACAWTARVPSDAGESFGGDAWRRAVCGGNAAWPASWTQRERLKFLSLDRRRLIKFEGLGPYSAEALRRSVVLFQEKWGPQAENEGDGFLSYAMAGRALRREECTRALLHVIARYCAARVRLFPAASVESELGAMLRTNVLEEFGAELPAAWVPAVERPVIADGRMQPYEWLLSPSGAVLKVDGIAHGDDHFFPGWTDIAWDLAGTIVEWGLDRRAGGWFLRCYRRASGDDPRSRIAAYVRAYATFRMAYSKMAAMAVGPGPESERLASDYRRYRRLAAASLTPRQPHRPERDFHAGARGRHDR